MIDQALAIYKRLNPANLSTSSAESPHSETFVNIKTYTDHVIDDGETSISKATDAIPSDPSGKIFSLQNPPREIKSSCSKVYSNIFCKSKKHDLM